MRETRRKPAKQLDFVSFPSCPICFSLSVLDVRYASACRIGCATLNPAGCGVPLIEWFWSLSDKLKHIGHPNRQAEAYRTFKTDKLKHIGHLQNYYRPLLSLHNSYNTHTIALARMRIEVENRNSRELNEESNNKSKYSRSY